MNLSQHLALYIRDTLGCSTVFTLTGGGAMFLNDAFGNTEHLRCIYNHHEQASAMGALGYSKKKGIGVCITTTGCGATNAITGLLDAWQDSQPVLFVSGQVKKKETTYDSGLPLRSFGVQELNIIPIVKSITKDAVYVGTTNDYFEFLLRLPDLLFGERPGPVWVDIPMDMQSKELSLEEVEAWENQQRLSSPKRVPASIDPILLNTLIADLKSARRPVFLVGNGLKLSNSGKGAEILEEILRDYGIPATCTYLAADVFKESLPNYLGVVGLKAARRANIALYNADFVLAIGTRLATSVIGFEYDLFAPFAKKYVVDIDPIEHKKATLRDLTVVESDAFHFLTELRSRLGNDYQQPLFPEWLDACIEMKRLLPIQEQFSTSGKVSIYDAVRVICENFGTSDVLVSDAGSAYYVSSIMFSRSYSQSYITSGAQADMGFTLPASIGVASAIADQKSRVHALTGDGSFQLNIQELQTLASTALPVTLYILNNNGYLSIRATQKSFFPGRQCGTDKNNGLEFPNIRKLCEAYGLVYRVASSPASLASIVDESNAMAGPIVCEVMCPEDEIIIPRTKTIKNRDGSLSSAPLCDMLPDIDPQKKEHLKNLGFIF